MVVGCRMVGCTDSGEVDLGKEEERRGGGMLEEGWDLEEGRVMVLEERA